MQLSEIQWDMNIWSPLDLFETISQILNILLLK